MTAAFRDPGRLGAAQACGNGSGRQLTPVQREGSRTRVARAGGQMEGLGEGAPRQSRSLVLCPSQRPGFAPREKLGLSSSTKSLLSSIVNTLFCKRALQVKSMGVVPVTRGRGLTKAEPVLRRPPPPPCPSSGTSHPQGSGGCPLVQPWGTRHCPCCSTFPVQQGAAVLHVEIPDSGCRAAVLEGQGSSSACRAVPLTPPPWDLG